MDKKYKAAVVGLGRIGFGFDSDSKRDYIATHSKAYSHVDGVELAAVCDMDREKVQACCKQLDVPAGYTDLKEMLDKERLDIVSICTPAGSHYAVLKEIVNYPVKAVFCEKPLAASLEEAKQMVDICASKGVILQTGHQRRFDPLHNEVYSLIKEARLGGVQQVNFYYTAGIYNTGSHMFDLLRYFFGDAEWIEGVMSSNEFAGDKDLNIDGMVKFRNGILATFQACDVKKYLIFELNCLLEGGKFILGNSGFTLDFYKVGESKYFSGYNELLKAEAPCKTQYKRSFMVNAVKHLIECARHSRESVSSGKDGCAAFNLIECAVSSAKNDGRRVKVN